MKRMIAGAVAIVLALTLTGCFGDGKPSEQRQKDQADSAKAYKAQSEAVPFPADELNFSLERANLRERLLRQNDPNRIGYVYYISFGEFLGYWTIKGKVSSTQSQMLPADDISGDISDCSGCSEHVVSESAGDDGSYGENERGVFFFTTEGAMIQLAEDDYIYSDQPIKVGSIPELNGDGEVKAAE